MKQENIKKFMEQIRSKKNVANELALAAEVNAVNVANAATAQTESNASKTVERSIALSNSLAQLVTGRYLQTPANSEFVNADSAVIGLEPPYYYFAVFEMDMASVSAALGLPEELIKTGKLRFTPESLSAGRCTLQVLNISNESLTTWDENEGSQIELNIMDLYDNSNLVSFAVIPLPGVNGTVGFSIEDMEFSYEWDATLVGLEITSLPTKTKYLVGEAFDTSGMVVKATYSDGLSCPVSSYTMTVSGFNSDNGIDSQPVRISVSLNGFTESKTMHIAVYPTQNVYYGTETEENLKNGLQVMDIHIPKNADETYKAGPFPAVITIHGGSWCGGDKGDYNYMTPFITNAPTAPDDYNNSEGEYIPGCNCVHVNMNYRLTTGDPSQNSITYVQMLEDIQSVINFISNNNNAPIYHIDTTKSIALMGHSAGAHLALLYAYSTADNYTNPNDNPIKLVISEAGPTYFYKENEELEGQDEIITDENICAMVGIGYKAESNEYNNNELTALWNASPLTYVTSNAPYTILAYGNGLSAKYDNYEGNNGDDTIPYSQATTLCDSLCNNGVLHQLYTLNGVGHNDFSSLINNSSYLSVLSSAFSTLNTN